MRPESKGRKTKAFDWFSYNAEKNVRIVRESFGYYYVKCKKFLFWHAYKEWWHGSRSTIQCYTREEAVKLAMDACSRKGKIRGIRNNVVEEFECPKN